MRTKVSPLSLRAAASLKRRKAIAALAVQEVIQIPYMKLRSRSLVMTHQVPRSSPSSRRRSPERMEESIGLPPRLHLFDSNPECNTKRSDSRDESTKAGITPPAAEIEGFFAAAEREEQQRFAAKYNYNVVDDVPLNGRYEWVRVDP
ncbi:hypothetical protein J5N97_002177 [Dioscorea zingiberensis]|uniref:Cyclin-dependent kinase inhibitor domain-containing protein n=1 Tax=Dioscorea zingiberensis TaxID=325984 RepID=A0A9D5HPC2_9LILI|nr:hypothetical protein J5N97_002177 [Dioscorea zingiberensis]